jgi:hypothetical protein
VKIVLLSIMTVALCGCSFTEIGKDLGGGLAEGAATKADSVGKHLVAGVVDTLSAQETRGKLNTVIDELGRALAKQAMATRDTLLGEYTRVWIKQLKEDLLGTETADQVGVLRDRIVGLRTRILLGEMRDELLGDSTKGKVAALRDELLGPATRGAVQAIVDSAMAGLVRRYRQDLRPELDAQRSFFERNATWFLVLVAGLSIVVIGFVWWQKGRYRKLAAILTYQIHEIPDQGAYDRFTRGVQKKAQEEGAEPLLRKVLTDQGLLGAAAWRPRTGG